MALRSLKSLLGPVIILEFGIKSESHCSSKNHFTQLRLISLFSECITISPVTALSTNNTSTYRTDFPISVDYTVCMKSLVWCHTQRHSTAGSNFLSNTSFGVQGNIEASEPFRSCLGSFQACWHTVTFGKLQNSPMRLILLSPS